MEEFDSYISQFIKQVRDNVDAACFLALESGTKGVKVTTNLGDGSITVEITEDVPFGEIHHHEMCMTFAPFE